MLYHTNGNGDTVYLDWLGSPWKIHGCFERYWQQEQERRKLKGEDLQFDLTLGFRDAIFGCEKTIRIQHLEVSSNSSVVPTIKTLTVNVPFGVDSETRLRVAGEGDASKSNGDPGDLYIISI